jgi:hypothetical protein
MKQKRFFHILRLLHFSNNRNEPDKVAESYEKLWKMRNICDKLSDADCKYYSLTEYLVFGEISVLLFSNSIYQRNINCFGQKSTSFVIVGDIYETLLCI